MMFIKSVFLHILKAFDKVDDDKGMMVLYSNYYKMGYNVIYQKL